MALVALQVERELSEHSFSVSHVMPALFDESQGSHQVPSRCQHCALGLPSLQVCESKHPVFFCNFINVLTSDKIDQKHY
jgi:hypothetical protein